jgi:hypothetical protein
MDSTSTTDAVNIGGFASVTTKHFPFPKSIVSAPQRSSATLAVHLAVSGVGSDHGNPEIRKFAGESLDQAIFAKN